MIRGEQIGVGIITCDRPTSFLKCVESIRDFPVIDAGIIINDGKSSVEFDSDHRWTVINNPQNLGVGRSKNIALRYLLNAGCKHLFLIEDDIYVKDRGVFQAYVKASKLTGIQHFNFSQHGWMNKKRTSKGEIIPDPRLTIKYPQNVSVDLYRHCVGAFSYYTKEVLGAAGLIDERYYNACEHVDHTYEILKTGMHPPFWYFADITDSEKYLGDEPWSLHQSVISSSPDHRDVITKADNIFMTKHGHVPVDTPDTPISEVFDVLKSIRNSYSISYY